MTENFEARFLAARRKYIASQFSNLNPMQQEAVLTTDGPLLLLAGAGSGKTTVLINRIANLMKYGCGADSYEIPDTVEEEDVLFMESLGDEISEFDRHRADWLCAVRPASPWSIIAITFTNKAANELKERLSLMLGPEAQDIWAMTFHSACCRILRRDIERMGYDRSFTIYDSSDSERVMKDIIKDMGLDDKTFPAKYVLGAISREKDNMVSAQEMLDAATYSRLAQRLPPPQAAIARQIARQEQSHISCLKGVYTLITGQKPMVPKPAVTDDPPDILLRRCYGREMRCLSQYEARQTDPQYGHIFRTLARQEQEHCHRILEILGTLSK